MNLKDDIFAPVARRVESRADSLRGLKRFQRTGFEAWLKVEVQAALGDKVVRLMNNGPDLVLTSGERAELKAATDLNVSYLSQGATKDHVPCLFLGDGSDMSRMARFADHGVEVIAQHRLSDGSENWVIGLIVPGKGKGRPNNGVW